GASPASIEAETTEPSGKSVFNRPAARTAPGRRGPSTPDRDNSTGRRTGPDPGRRRRAVPAAPPASEPAGFRPSGRRWRQLHNGRADLAHYSMIPAPLFLVGAERSGTTLLRLMLDGHPDLAWNEEFEYAVDLLPEEGGFPDLEDYYPFLKTNRVFLHSGHR